MSIMKKLALAIILFTAISAAGYKEDALVIRCQAKQAKIAPSCAAIK